MTKMLKFQSDIAPFCRKIRGTQYCMHHLNPTYARDCTKARQVKRAEAIHGWGNRVEVVPVSYGEGGAIAYVIYVAGEGKRGKR
jgi:hypothetical protein